MTFDQPSANMSQHFTWFAKMLTLVAISAVSLGQAHAMKADREQPIDISANHFQGDEVEQSAIYTGAAIFRQGTLEIRGDRLKLETSPTGYRLYTVTGKPAHFKEQNDSNDPKVEEWTYATGNTAIYDERRSLLTLEENATVKRYRNGKLTESTQGQTIIYDLRTARARVENQANTTHNPSSPGTKLPNGRVQTILTPRQ